MLFDLKETITPFQLEAGIILQSPCSTYWLLQIALALPDLISYRMRTDSEVARMGTCTHTHTQASHIIKSAFEPSGFYCARLENEASKPMSEASAPFSLPSLHSAPPATNWYI